MIFDLLRDARLFAFLQKCDEDLAADARAAGCRCGGVLHSARYPRKPRGGPADLGSDYDHRLSLCCAEEDCRRRTTPPSLRFLGRKVYLGAVVVLVSAMRHGATPGRVAKLRDRVGASRRTVARWRAWWREAFAQSPFWKAARGGFDAPVAADLLPLSLIERFRGDARDRLVAALRFLFPITTSSARGAMAF
ncbi:MAG: hypothetical protein HYY06_19395 [Deltaproteobacteria bacterium]|nr:hypothetical protein [Deltaproteobacteria bacterium]